jgi:hypothetical protein
MSLKLLWTVAGAHELVNSAAKTSKEALPHLSNKYWIGKQENAIEIGTKSHISDVFLHLISVIFGSLRSQSLLLCTHFLPLAPFIEQVPQQNYSHGIPISSPSPMFKVVFFLLIFTNWIFK